MLQQAQQSSGDVLRLATRMYDGEYSGCLHPLGDRYPEDQRHLGGICPIEVRELPL